MALVQYTRSNNANPLLYQTDSILGYRNVPFNRKTAVPTNYNRVTYTFLGGNTHLTETSKARAGGTYAEENGLGGALGAGNPIHDRAYARAYGKFKDRVYSGASLLTALAERQKTINMMAIRLKQLHKGAMHLKKGQFRSFLKTFGLAPKPKHLHKRWARPRDFASLWLEYWMGWAPTVGDVYSALDFLGSTLPVKTVRAGSRMSYDMDKTVISSRVQKYTYSQRGFHSVWVQASIVLTNPNLFSLQGLGLANPLKTVWETIPFSWFADWFLNVGQVIGQISDWLGLQVKDLVVSCKTTYTSTWICDDARYTYGWGSPKILWRTREFLGFRRTVGGTLPPVRPIVRIPDKLAITRGATLASLLVQLFAPKKAIPLGV